MDNIYKADGTKLQIATQPSGDPAPPSGTNIKYEKIY